MKTLLDLAQKLNRKKLTSRQLVEHCLSHIDNTDGEGKNVFISVFRERALSEADAADKARSESRHSSPFCGIPVSIKDLFDIAGQVTTAGSHVLDEQPPANHDATIVQRLRNAGFIIIGKTTMTEFAYSGLGINPHYGTPANPFERAIRHIPGGSSSGAAVSVSDNMAAAAIGTDTGGSTRIPAALCGLVGFKPTAERVPLDGCIPLSTSLDSIGPIANTVTCCAVLNAIMSGDSTMELAEYPQVGIRLGVLDGFVMENLDKDVANAYHQTLERLGKRGILTKTIHLPELENYNAHINKGSLLGGEAAAWHKPYLDSRKEFYDPWIHRRIESCLSFTAADYVETVARRRQCQIATAERTLGLDAIVMPTVPLPPIPIARLENDTEEARRSNLLYLRNTSTANALNAPAISIPCHKPDAAPVGFMLMGQTGEDKKLLSIAKSLEPIIRRQP
ncbi:hypothetical protein AB833_06640 [Chromatiales bacterium (ex Bugula neritina AB1)]|nr:hypothetical protein AB833_06640 [Chromatiales bacterium (ex Bugula neritina AB1)]